MKLQHPFPPHKREVFRDAQYCCWECGGNGANTGGTELHHILGRVSSSVFNGAVLCKKCHARMSHHDAEHTRLLTKTLKYVISFIKRGEYRPDQEDEDFLVKHARYYPQGTTV